MTTELSKLLTSCLTAAKKHVIKYCEKVYERSGKNLFWSIKNSGEILDKLKARDFNATSLSTYDFSTLYTTLPTGPRSAVGNVSGYRCVSDCISRGCEFDPGPVPYFRGD